MAAEGTRPAHRPSRKQALVDAAILLFTTRPVDSVTAAEIAREAGMTPAALYYHFHSKDELLVETLRAFGEDFETQVRAARRRHGSEPDGLRAAVVDLLRWVLLAHPARSLLYFVTSSGLNLQVEQLRRQQRGEIVMALRALLLQHHRSMSAPEAGVVAAALVSLFEVAAALPQGDDQRAEMLVDLGADLAVQAADGGDTADALAG